MSGDLGSNCSLPGDHALPPAWASGGDHEAHIGGPHHLSYWVSVTTEWDHGSESAWDT